MLGLLPRQTRPVILGGFAATAAVGLAILALAAPICLHGGFAQLPPSLHETWLIRVPEGRPVWEKSWSLALQIALPLVIALWAPLLARARPREGRYGRIVAAVLIQAIYFNLIGAGESWLSHGVVGIGLGLWWVHGLFLLFGLGLLLHYFAGSRGVRLFHPATWRTNRA